MGDRSVCRTCLRVNDKVKIPLFKQITYDSNTELELSEMISEVTKITYEPDDRLPEVVCYTCVSDICRAYFFRRNCIKSELVLKEKLGIPIDIKEEQGELDVTEYEIIEEIDVEHDPSTINFDDQLIESDYIEENADEDVDWSSSLIDFKPETLNIQDGQIIEYADETAISTDEYTMDTEDYIRTGEEKKPLLAVLKDTDKDFLFRCQFCVRKYLSFGNLSKHRREKHPEHKADFKQRLDYYNEYLLSEGANFFEYDPDGTKGTTEKPAEFQCQYCADKFVTMFHLKRHFRQNHVDDVKNPNKVLCDICGKAVLNKMLELHKRSHTNERPFACKFCDKRFKAEIYLEDHQKRHTDTISFFCDVCSKGFTRKKGLVSHFKLIHSGTAPQFDCHLCEKSLSSKQALKNHILVHNGDNPYREIEKNRPKRIRNKKHNASQSTRGLQIQVIASTEEDDSEMQTIEYDPITSEY